MTVTRRALLTLGIAAAAATLSGCDGTVYEYEGTITAKWGDGEIQHPDSPFTFTVDLGDGNVIDAPVSEYDYGRFDTGDWVHVRGTNGNVWQVTS